MNNTPLINIYFPHGLYGFPSYQKFDIGLSTHIPFYRCVSQKNKHLNFILLDPAIVFHYQAQLSSQDKKILELKSEKDMIYFLIVNTFRAVATVNLKAPLVINPIKRIGIQAIVLNEDYTIKTKISELS